MVAALDLSNPVFASFAGCSVVLVFKMMGLGLLTSVKRIGKKVFANEEDCKGFSAKTKPNFADTEIERLRRNHLNDLENIPPFILTGIFYVLTGPTLSTALWHFRIYVASRILHTISYQMALPQPSRALCHAVGLGVTISMAVQVLMAVY